MFAKLKTTTRALCIAVTALGASGAIAPAMAQEPMLGEIKFFAGNFAPRNWAFCDGQLLSIAQHTALFSILGTTYGGDGRTTFGLPDMRGRSMVHEGTGPGLPPVRLGQKGGAPTHQMSVNEMPSHTHSATSTSTAHAVSAGGTLTAPAGNFLADDGSDRIYSNAAADVTMNAGAVTTTTTNANSGGSAAFNIQDPYVSTNCIIALQGFFPSRS